MTLIGFSPAPGGFRVVAAEADVLDEVPPDLGIPRGFVRFPVGAVDGFDWWCEAGANHHLALTRGRHAGAVQAFAEVSGIESRLLAG